MKKLIALLLAMIMVCGLATTAFAVTTDDNGDFVDESTITISKTYNLTNEGTTSPAETFTFSTLTCTNVENGGLVNGANVTKDNAPVPTIGKIEYSAGEAGSDNKVKTATITLPTYQAVGIYTYTFYEIDGNTAGVTYREEDDLITLVVTVIEQDGKVRVAAVHTEESGDKSDDFENEYSAGSLAVKKTVSGNMADKQKDFTVTVKFTAPAGDTVREAITYTDDGENLSIAAGWTGETEVTIDLKHDETVTFENVPYGVTYVVTENDYTEETDEDGYDAPEYDANKEGTIEADAVETVINNNKEADVDTGVALDSAPYIVMLVVAMVGMVALVAKKRYEV